MGALHSTPLEDFEVPCDFLSNDNSNRVLCGLDTATPISARTPLFTQTPVVTSSALAAVLTEHVPAAANTCPFHTHFASNDELVIVDTVPPEFKEAPKSTDAYCCSGSAPCLDHAYDITKWVTKIIYILCPPWPPQIIRKAAFHPPEKGKYYYIVVGEGASSRQIFDASEAYGQPNLRICFRSFLLRNYIDLRTANGLCRVQPYIVRTAANHYLAAVHVRCYASVVADCKAPYIMIASQPNSSDLGACMISDPSLVEIADCLHCDVFGYDYSGYGCSSGHPSQEAIYQNIEAIYNYVSQVLGYADNRILLFGFSMGTAASIHLASMRSNLAGLILVAPFTSLFRIVGRTDNPCTSRWDQFCSYDKAPTISCRTLICHGMSDAMIRPQHSEVLYGRLSNSAPIFYVPDATHRGIYSEIALWRRIREFGENDICIPASWKGIVVFKRCGDAPNSPLQTDTMPESNNASNESGQNDTPSTKSQADNEFCKVVQFLADSSGVTVSAEEHDLKRSRRPVPPRSRQTPCRHFLQKGKCRWGDSCRFLHVVSDASAGFNPQKHEKKVIESENVEPEASPPQIQVAVTPLNIIRKPLTLPKRVILKAEQLGSPEQASVKSSDEAYFKRRFPKTKVSADKDKATTVIFNYGITDPDWVFDVKSLRIMLKLAPGHPIEMPTISIDQDIMPDALHKYLIDTFQNVIQKHYEACQTQNAFEAIGKWLIRQLDRHIFEAFVAGLKKAQWLLNAEAAGLKVTVFEPSTASKRPLTTLDDIKDVDDADFKQTTDPEDTLATEDNTSQLGRSATGPKQHDVPMVSTGKQFLSRPWAHREQPPAEVKKVEAPKIDVVATWIDGEQSIGTLTFKKLSGAAKCRRCGTQEFFDVNSGSSTSWQCKRCNSSSSIRLEAVLGHANSQVVAAVYPVGCTPHDCVLQASKLVVSCLNCSSDAVVEALPYSTPTLAWCRQCNSKMRLSVESVGFKGNFGAIQQGSQVRSQAKKKPVDEGPLFVKGQPLPRNGTCKHYGKSFRYFRFPCCGKVFPCDVCHTESEGPEHEVKYATRMICGFCSTEQPFSDNTCTFCNSSTTRLKSAFWEGGKGCRDQSKMNRNDPRKHKGGAGKTVPTKRTGPKRSQSPKQKS